MPPPLQPPSVNLLILPVPTLLRNLRSALPAALVALSLAAGAHTSSGQSTTIQRAHDLGLTLTQKTPYNFTGRIFDFDAVGFGSGTLLRRHTVLTAGHVVYDPLLGFTTNTTFTRALYENYSLSKDPVTKAAALAGYQSAVNLTGTNNTNSAFAQDQGYLLLNDAPVDENWANFIANPALLTSSTTQFVVLGYPGVTFDGRTMAYIVPQSPFVQLSTTGSYTNENYIAEPGMSGGPIYVVLDNSPNERYVAADTVGGIDDSTAEFNVSYVRAIDKTSNKFLVAAEYVTPLTSTTTFIKHVKVSGPKTVARGTTATFSAVPVFAIPGTTGARNVTTSRYPEIKVKSNVIATPGQAGITVKMTSNTTFDVFVPNVTSVRPGSQVTLQAYYDYKSRAAAPGKSTFTFTIQ